MIKKLKDRWKDLRARLALQNIQEGSTYSSPKDRDRFAARVVSNLSNVSSEARLRIEDALDSRYTWFGEQGRELILNTVIQPLEQSGHNIHLEERDRIALRAGRILHKLDESIHRTEEILSPYPQNIHYEKYRQLHAQENASRYRIEEVLYSHFDWLSDYGKEVAVGRLLKRIDTRTKLYFGTGVSTAEQDEAATRLVELLDTLPDILRRRTENDLLTHLKNLGVIGRRIVIDKTIELLDTLPDASRRRIEDNLFAHLISLDVMDRKIVADKLMEHGDDRSKVLQSALNLFVEQSSEGAQKQDPTLPYRVLPDSLEVINHKESRMTLTRILREFLPISHRLTKESRQQLEDVFLRNLHLFDVSDRKIVVEKLIEHDDERGNLLSSTLGLLDALLRDLPPDVYERYAGSWKYEVLPDALRYLSAGDGFQVDYRPQSSYQESHPVMETQWVEEFFQEGNYTQGRMVEKLVETGETYYTTETIPESLELRRISQST